MDTSKKYYLKKGEELTGPFSVDELAAQGLLPSDRLFATGWTEFRTASDIPELEETLKNVRITGKSESEMLSKLMERLDSLEQQNKQLLREVSSLKADTPEADSRTPPPAPSQPDVSQLRAWDEYMNRDSKEKSVKPEPLPPYDPAKDTSKGTVPAKDLALREKKSSTNIGCILLCILALIVCIIAIVLGIRKSRHSYVEEESNGYYYEDPYYSEDTNIAAEAAPPEYAAPAAEAAAPECAAPAECAAPI